jgi:hypothetical protein
VLFVLMNKDPLSKLPARISTVVSIGDLWLAFHLLRLSLVSPIQPGNSAVEFVIRQSG